MYFNATTKGQISAGNPGSSTNVGTISEAVLCEAATTLSAAQNVPSVTYYLGEPVQVLYISDIFLPSLSFCQSLINAAMISVSPPNEAVSFDPVTKQITVGPTTTLSLAANRSPPFKIEYSLTLQASIGSQVPLQEQIQITMFDPCVNLVKN